MSNPNLGWLFYKELYRKGNDPDHIKNTLAKMQEVSAPHPQKEKLANFGFTLTTTYPGLLIGSGYTHGISSDDDVKTGFYFDHTTGLPQIPGSSVKGVLRSFFKLLKDKDQEALVTTFFEEIFQEAGISETIDKTFLQNLEKEIFDGKNPQTDKPLPIYQRDKFFDAVVVKVGKDGLLSEDYITPHKEPLKNPIPVKILKVAPKVSFAFAFDLKDGTLSAAQKELLFLKLLLFSGVGAKTNVGYGQFEEWSQEAFEKMKQKHKRDIVNNLENDYEKLMAKLKEGIIKNAKPIHDAIKKIEKLEDKEKEELKKLIDEIITDKGGKWYKKIEKLL